MRHDVVRPAASVADAAIERLRPFTTTSTHLGLDALDVVNLRVMKFESSELRTIAEPSTALVELQQEGLFKHLGLSTVSAEQIEEAQSIAPVICVQNLYNIANVETMKLIDSLAARGIAYVPYFPLGGFPPLSAARSRRFAERLGATLMAVALAWLLQRSEKRASSIRRAA